MDCLFCKIAQGEIPANVEYEDEDLMAFHDIRPVAPSHLLIIPKEHIPAISNTQDKHEALLGKMVLRAKKLAETLDIHEKGYRLVFNVNSGGGQEVYHIHLHLIGGRQMTWPPG